MTTITIRNISITFKNSVLRALCYQPFPSSWHQPGHLLIWFLFWTFAFPRTSYPWNHRRRSMWHFVPGSVHATSCFWDFSTLLNLSVGCYFYCFLFRCMQGPQLLYPFTSWWINLQGLEILSEVAIPFTYRVSCSETFSFFSGVNTGSIDCWVTWFVCV